MLNFGPSRMPGTAPPPDASPSEGRGGRKLERSADRLRAYRNTTCRNTIADRLELYKTGGIHKLCEIQEPG